MYSIDPCMFHFLALTIDFFFYCSLASALGPEANEESWKPVYSYKGAILLFYDIFCLFVFDAKLSCFKSPFFV